MTEFYIRAMKKFEKLDGTQRKDLLISAVREIDLMSTVLNTMGIGILVCDEKNNLVRLNKSAKRLFNLGNITGIDIFTALKDERTAAFFKEILNSREKVTGREFDIMQEGRSILISVNVLPLVQEKRIRGSIIYIEDITERRIEQERLRRAENLASLTTLAAGVAHEIKNPLASISIHLQLLQKDLAKCENCDKRTKNYFNIIKEEINRLNGIVVDFLFAVRPLTLELRESDINSIIHKLIDFVSIEMEQSNIECRLELDETIPKILLDERFIKQTILNLINNAQAAMQDGGILTVTTSLAENEIRIQIGDTGTGIKKEDFSKIFDPYFTTKESGTGLGLTLVYKIIKEHRGEITVNSKYGEGTVFEIMLPVPQKETKLIGYTGTA